MPCWAMRTMAIHQPIRRRARWQSIASSRTRISRARISIGTSLSPWARVSGTKGSYSRCWSDQSAITIQLVAGERRLRAAQALGLTEVPVHVVEFDDQQTLEAALAENINRADLNPIEKARGFKDYLARFGTTQEQLANRLGVDRTTISNLINLLDLPSEVQEAVRLGQIQVGHAKAIKGLSDPERQVAMCKEIIARGYNVRMAETLVKDEKSEPASSPARTPPKKTAHVQAIEDDLRQRLATRVEIRLRERHKGQIILSFESNDDFERLLDAWGG